MMRAIPQLTRRVIRYLIDLSEPAWFTLVVTKSSWRDTTEGTTRCSAFPIWEFRSKLVVKIVQIMLIEVRLWRSRTHLFLVVVDQCKIKMSISSLNGVLNLWFHNRWKDVFKVTKVKGCISVLVHMVMNHDCLDTQHFQLHPFSTNRSLVLLRE